MEIPNAADIVRIDTTADHPFRQFALSTRGVSGIVAREFGEVRADAQPNVPAVIIYSDEYVEAEVAPGTEDGRVGSFGGFAYHPESHVIIGSQGEVQRMWEQPEGRSKLRLILAEEIIHAQSAFVSDNGTRVGYIQLPFRRRSHTLLPGAIYDATSLRPTGREFRPEPIMETSRYQRQALLTERATQMMIYGLLPQLFPAFGLERSLVVIGNGKNNSLVFPMMMNSLALRAKTSLTSGDVEKLWKDGTESKKLRQMLTDPASLGFMVLNGNDFDPRFNHIA